MPRCRIGKAQHSLHDDKLPGLALRVRATGGRTWVCLFTKPGVRETQPDPGVRGPSIVAQV
jgi:hypothetical protein